MAKLLLLRNATWFCFSQLTDWRSNAQWSNRLNNHAYFIPSHSGLNFNFFEEWIENSATLNECTVVEPFERQCILNTVAQWSKFQHFWRMNWKFCTSETETFWQAASRAFLTGLVKYALKRLWIKSPRQLKTFFKNFFCYFPFFLLA